MTRQITIILTDEQLESVMDEGIRAAIESDTWARQSRLVDAEDGNDVMLRAALEYFTNRPPAANDADAYARGFEAGVLSGDASDAGLAGYQLGRREERERCAWMAERMADDLSDPSWTLACYALADKIRGKT